MKTVNQTVNQTTGMVSEFYVLSVLLRCGIKMRYLVNTKILQV